jgi:hypothetical protein
MVARDAPRNNEGDETTSRWPTRFVRTRSGSDGHPTPGASPLTRAEDQPERGSQEKRRRAAIKPATPHAATTTTSVQLNGVPMKPAWRPEAKW